MRGVRPQPHEAAAGIHQIGRPIDEIRIAQLLDEAEGAAHRNSRGYAKVAGRQRLALSLMNEEVDKHLPSGFAK